jgi:hypothetical protein
MSKVHVNHAPHHRVSGCPRQFSGCPRPVVDEAIARGMSRSASGPGTSLLETLTSLAPLAPCDDRAAGAGWSPTKGGMA